jgi:tetratricopeptide (TPR) repeat protein
MEMEDHWNIATALRNLGWLDNIQGNYQEAVSSLEQSLEIWREMGAEGRMGMAQTLMYLGDVALNQRNTDMARSLYMEVALILGELGEISVLAYSIRRLAQLAWREGQYQKAMDLCKQSLALNREVDDPRGIIACQAGFAAIAVAKGELGRAATLMASVETQLNARGGELLYMDRMEYERDLTLLHRNLTVNPYKVLNKGCHDL